MCQVTAKSCSLTPPTPPPPPPPPSPKADSQPQPQPRTYAPSDQPPPSSNLLSTQAQPQRLKSRLNPHAEPFSPLTNTPFIAVCVLHPPAMTRPKKLVEKKQKKKLVHHVKRIWAPVKSDIDPQVLFAGGNTTLMIKNIPNRLKRHELLQILDTHCWEENMKAKLHPDPCWSEYDFLYLPMDFGYGANLGYAFVNFTTTVASMRFANAFHKRGWEAQVPGNKKICEISRAAIQGRDALKNHFEHLKFNCRTDSYLPVMLSPPSDGRNHAKATIVGKRIDDPICQRKLPLMMRRRALMK